MTLSGDDIASLVVGWVLGSALLAGSSFCCAGRIIRKHVPEGNFPEKTEGGAAVAHEKESASLCELQAHDRPHKAGTLQVNVRTASLLCRN